MVIADGGFQANLDMLRANGISTAPEKLLARNGGTAVGEGFDLLGTSCQENDLRAAIEQTLREDPPDVSGGGVYCNFHVCLLVLRMSSRVVYERINDNQRSR